MSFPPREYPQSPLVAAAAVVVDGDRVLLVRRGREPARGRWSAPGGLVELGEGTAAAAEREAREEAGLSVRATEVLAVVDRVARDGDGRVRSHYVIVDWLATPLGGAIRAGDDAEAVAWLTLGEAAALPLTEGLMPVLEAALARARGGRG